MGVLLRNAPQRTETDRRCNDSWDRFAIVCVFHPIAQEFFLTVQRQIGSETLKKFENDPDREYYALKTLVNPSNIEECMVMQRRRMLGGMRDPIATVLTIVIT